MARAAAQPPTPSDAADAKSADGAQARQRLPAHAMVNVLTLPAQDEADEIVGLMLTQLLAFQGYNAKNLSVTALASEMLDRVKKEDGHIVIVSAMPPAAATHARYLCKRLHLRYPDLAMVVGLWTAKGELKRAKDRITCVAHVQLVTALAEAIDQIDQMAKQITVQQAPPADKQAQVA